MNKHEKGEIYNTSCANCDKCYIGKTRNGYKVRFNKHIQAIKSNNLTSQKSSFAGHVLVTWHGYKTIYESIKILAIERKGEINEQREFINPLN